ncbi:hypothetical protein AT6N2_C3017 [Agrobacterium tumefaciens]|nr:hypothetical protein AT6N2_C3017 [Agrobacterium tumefaciens]
MWSCPHRWGPIFRGFRPRGHRCPRHGEPSARRRTWISPFPIKSFAPSHALRPHWNCRPRTDRLRPVRGQFTRSGPLDRLQLGFGLDELADGIVDDLQIVHPPVAFHPLTAEDRGLADIGMRPGAEFDRADQRVEIGRLQRVAHRGAVHRILGAFERIDGNLPERVGIAQRLDPLLLHLAFPGIGHIAADFAGQRRLEREGRRPPDFRTHAVAERPHGLDARGKEKGRGDRDDLRIELLLAALGDEGLQVRHIGDAADDVAAAALILGNLRGEVVRARLEHARHDGLEAGFFDRRRQSVTAIAPGLAIGIARKQHADIPVGFERLPETDEGCERILKPPEEMVGPVERLLVAAARHDESLPGRGRRNAGNAVEFRLIGGRIDDIRRRCRDQKLDILVQDQFARQFRRFVRIGLGVAHQNIDLVGLAVVLDTVGQQRLDDLDGVAVGFAEGRKRSRQRTDETHLDLAAGCACQTGHGERRCGGAHGFQRRSTRKPRLAYAFQ